MSIVLTDRIDDALRLAEQEKLLTWTEKKSKSSREIASHMAEHLLVTADGGVKIAAIVMLHNACERFLYRLVRFGLVANRTQVLNWIAARKVSVKALAERDTEELIDDQIEKWWDDLERDSLLSKWDKLIALVGYPQKLDDGAWHFDRDMLSDFDDVRHNAVHHDGQRVKALDLAGFAKQLWRAQLVWVVEIAVRLDLQVPADVFFGLK